MTNKITFRLDQAIYGSINAMGKNGVTFFVSLAIFLSAGCDKNNTVQSRDTKDVIALRNELDSVNERIREIEESMAQIPPGASIDGMIDKAKSDIAETSARIEALRLGIRQVNDQIRNENQ